ncbi:M23 family metallopeptidase [bacterium]|nr:M23 family metallopeptidase [bacterium]
MKINNTEIRYRALLSIVCVLLSVPAFADTPQARTPIVQSIDIQAPLAPVPVRIAGKSHVAYELHITNFRTIDVLLTRVEVLDADRMISIADFRDSELAKRLGHPGASGDIKEPRLVLPGRRVVVYFWLPVKTSASAPIHLQHRIELDLVGPSATEHLIVQDGVLNVREEKPVLLDPPLRKGPWVALYDPMMPRGHRTSIYTVNGRARIPARFAIDWILLDSDSKHARGDDSKVANWYGYGVEVLAVADGIVVSAFDEITEAPLIGNSQGPIALENASGNFVTLDLGNGKYAFYEHLKYGSIKVKTGDHVKSGQVIGLLGNSGSSSSGPHLHFHVSDANSTLAAEGEPFEFKQFEVVSAFDSIEAFAKGERWKPANADSAGIRNNELPAANVVVHFPN